MLLENPLSLPHAHQQIRLGDIQSSVHKWSIAIEYYIHAIEYFKAIQNTLCDNSLILNIQAQIVQCEKTINLCRLKDRSEQAQQAERSSKLIHAYSSPNLQSSMESNRIMSRRNTLQKESPVLVDGTDSFAAFILPTNNSTRTAIFAKKNKKHDSHKIEELQMSYEALKLHLKTAFDDIERLKYENKQLRIQQETKIIQEQTESKLLTHNDEEVPETELEATL